MTDRSRFDVQPRRRPLHRGMTRIANAFHREAIGRLIADNDRRHLRQTGDPVERRGHRQPALAEALGQITRKPLR